MYLFLSTLFAGAVYFVYKTYIEAFFPQTHKRGNRGAGKGVKPAEEKDAALSGSEAVTTGTDKGYDESWIPTDHINRPSAKRVKSSASGKLKKASE